MFTILYQSYYALWVQTIEYRKQATMIRGQVLQNVEEVLEQAGCHLPCHMIEVKPYHNQ